MKDVCRGRSSTIASSKLPLPGLRRDRRSWKKKLDSGEGHKSIHTYPTKRQDGTVTGSLRAPERESLRAPDHLEHQRMRPLPSDPLSGALSDPLSGAPSEPPTGWHSRRNCATASLIGLFSDTHTPSLMSPRKLW